METITQLADRWFRLREKLDELDKAPCVTTEVDQLLEREIYLEYDAIGHRIMLTSPTTMDEASLLAGFLTPTISLLEGSMLDDTENEAACKRLTTAVYALAEFLDQHSSDKLPRKKIAEHLLEGHCDPRQRSLRAA